MGKRELGLTRDSFALDYFFYEIELEKYENVR